MADWREALDLAVGAAPIATRPRAVPVIMCAWRRPARLFGTIQRLQQQVDCPPLHLIVWNNHWAHQARCRRAVDSAGIGGALAAVRLIGSRKNLGGIARFVVMRRLGAAGYQGPVVTIDDDMDLGPTFVADLLRHWSPREIRGVWAFRIRGDYWDRVPATLDGEAADYVGTGGAVIDPVIASDEFFARLPDRFGSNEDLWMSRWAAVHGWSLAKVATPHHFEVDGRNQGRRVDERKPELWRIADRLAAGERLHVASDARGGAGRIPVGDLAGAILREGAERVGIGALVRAARRRGRASDAG